MLDGHESHANYLFLDFAWRHRILVQVLPAHSSHLTQPLDVGLFSPLQSNYGKLVMDWSKGGGFPAISKCDFWPLLQQAREQTYTPKNIESAWLGAGLVPYNKRKILDRLGGPSLSSSSNIPQGALSTPKNARQFRSFMVYTEQMMESEGVGELVMKTIRTLAKLSLQEQALGAVVKHEADQLKGRLKMKEGHRKSRVRLVKVNMSNGILITKEEIDQLKLELEEKEAKAAEKQLRAEEKKSRQGQKQLAIPRPRKQKKVSFASVESIEFHVLTDTGQYLISRELPLLMLFSDEEDDVVMPSASTSRSGRAIKPSRRIIESLNIFPKKSKDVTMPPLSMVTRSKGGKK